MNFLDAHRIVHQFCEAVGKGATGGFFPISSIPFEFDKDKIINAFEIFFAHMIVFKTRTQEEYNVYSFTLQRLDMFKTDIEIARMEQLYKLGSKKGLFSRLIYGDKIKTAKKEYGEIILAWTKNIESYKFDEVCECVNSLGNFIKDELKKIPRQKNADSDNDYIIEILAKKAYELANIEFKDEYFYFFQRFDSMRKLITLPQFKDYYKEYEEYIGSSK